MQQFTYNFELVSSISLHSRSRLEQRFFENFEDAGIRFRRLVSAVMQFDNSPSISVVTSDEYFVDLKQTDDGAWCDIDQKSVVSKFGLKY